MLVVQVALVRREVDALKEELDIAKLDPKEANIKFLARVNNLKNVSAWSTMSVHIRGGRRGEWFELVKRCSQ